MALFGRLYLVCDSNLRPLTHGIRGAQAAFDRAVQASLHLPDAVIYVTDLKTPPDIVFTVRNGVEVFDGAAPIAAPAPKQPTDPVATHSPPINKYPIWKADVRGNLLFLDGTPVALIDAQQRAAFGFEGKTWEVNANTVRSGYNIKIGIVRGTPSIIYWRVR